MSYSLNDNFYIDTNTSIATLKGNLDLLNTLRFAKTETNEGITLQGNIIKDRIQLDSPLYSINNFQNSNTPSIQLQNIYNTAPSFKLLLDIENTGTASCNLTILSKNVNIPGNHRVCLKVDYPNTNPENTYFPYLGTKIYSLDYVSSNDHDYFVGYTSGSNTLIESSTFAQLNIQKPTGYFLHNQPNHIFEKSWHLLADESYFSSVIVHSNHQLFTGVYKNNTMPSGVSFTTIQGSTVHPALFPLTFNDYYPFIVSNYIETNTITFLKYFRTQGNSTLMYPNLIPFNTSHVLYTFLAKTDPLLPINSYTYNFNTHTFALDTLSIPGTSFANNYQYVLIKLNTHFQATYQWFIRIVLKSINLSIQHPLSTIIHEDNSFTVTILNNQLTDIIVYNTDRSTTVLTNCYNSILRFSKDGIYQWSTKIDPLDSLTVSKNLLQPYTSNTFFIHASFNNSIKSLINVYNSDGTTFNTIDTTKQNTLHAIIYYGSDGKARHYNQFAYTYPDGFTQSLFSSTSSSNQGLIYAQLNTSILSKVNYIYTDAFLNQTNDILYANSIQLNNLQFSTDIIGQKQLNFGEDIKQLRMNTDNIILTGNANFENDLSIRQLYTRSNIYMATNSRIGIGTTNPRFGLDILGGTSISGNVGIGTTILASKCTIQSINQDPFTIENLSVINFPIEAFLTPTSGTYGPNYYYTSNSIDPSPDIQEIPPPPGSSYLNYLQDFAALSTYRISSTLDSVNNGADKAFDKNYNTSWRSATGRYTSGTGLPTTAVFTRVNGTNVYGDWLQISLPKEYFTKPTMRLKLHNYTLSKDSSGVGVPMSWMVLGSNDVNTLPEEWRVLLDPPITVPTDDIGWTLLDQRTNYTLTTNSSNFTIASSNTAYGHYRIIVTKINTGYTYCSIGEMYYYMNIRFRNSYPLVEASTGHKAITNSHYGFFDITRDLHNPITLLNGPVDSSVTLGKYWRSGTVYQKLSLVSSPAVLEFYYPSDITFNTYGFIGTSLNTMPTAWQFDYKDLTNNWITLDLREDVIVTDIQSTYYLPTTYTGKQFRFSLSNINSMANDYIELKRVQIGILNKNISLTVNKDDQCYILGGVGIGTTLTTSATGLAVTGNTYFYNDISMAADVKLRGIVDLAYGGENSTYSGGQGHRGIEWNYDPINRWGMVHDSLYNLAIYSATSVYDSLTYEGSAITFNRANGYDNNATIALEEYARINRAGNVGIGTTRPQAKLHIHSTQNASNSVVILNRTINGRLMDFQVNNITQGSISVNGATVTYGTFTGGHWSQLSNNFRIDIPKGTVVSTIDDLAEWKLDEWYGLSNNHYQLPYYGPCNIGYTYYDSNQYLHTITLDDNDYLPKCKISDVYQDKRVYGIFSHWDEEGDMVVHSLGTTQIRVTGSCLGGDLLMSKGDGTAIPQEDDLMRSYTIGKVTIGISTSLPDSIQLVPCVLYCG